MKQLFTLLASAICIFSLNAQDKTDRTIFVRFKEGKTIDLKDQLIRIDGNSQLQNQLNSLGEWKKTYTIPDEKLDSLIAVAEKNLHKNLPDLNQDFRFIVNDVTQLEKVIGILKESQTVESVKKAPRLFNCSAPDYQSFQTYIQHATTGINAEDVWSVYNNHGEDIKIYDIEYFFNSSHLDLPNVTICGPTPVDPFGGSGGDHGTAVMGELASRNDGVGTTGIAYGSDIYFGGAFYDDNYQLENALIESTLHLNPSDVVLIEQQTVGPNYDESSGSQYGLVAVEWIREFYDAIQVVVGQGIIVVEAAGNGQQDFDASIYSMDNDGHYPFLPGNGSGAIIVGAGSSGTSDIERSTLWFSNFGSAVDVQGIGESIYSTGYGDLFSVNGANEYYTADFGGTSGASPIVTGSVALLQSTYRNQTGLTLTRDQIVSIFQLTGQPQNDGTFSVSDAHIGPLPDVKAAIDYALAHAGVEELSSTDLIAYPNPNSGIFTINFNQETGDFTTELHDLSGNSIPFVTKTLSDQYVQISTEHLPAGVYFFSVTSGNRKQTIKLMID